MSTETETHLQGHPCVKCGDNRVPHEGGMCSECEATICAQCGGRNEQQGRDRDLCGKCGDLEEAILKHAWRLYGAAKSSRNCCEHIYEPTLGAHDIVQAQCCKCGYSPGPFPGDDENALRSIIETIETEAKQKQNP